MKKYIYLAVVVVFIVAVFFRINVISSIAGKEAPGIEQYYKENGIPVEAGKVNRGEFLVFCRVNAQVLGLKQTEIATQVAAKILKVHHEVGDRVRADEVIVSLDKEDPRSSAQYRQLKAVYETTLLNHRRILELRESGAVSQSELDEIKMKLDVDRANLESVVKSVSLSSPVDGVILDINAREGELITPSKPVAVVARVDRVRLVSEVSESDIRGIKAGQRVIVDDAQGGEQSTGTVTKVSLNANPKTGLFRIEMEVANKNGELRIGTYTTAKVEVLRDPQALYTDLRALQQDLDGSYYVYVLSGDRALKKPVEISGMNDDYVRILAGVSENDSVVTNGFTRLSDNARILF
jgi:RND family efflux transporter MFP subunit